MNPTRNRNNFLMNISMTSFPRESVFFCSCLLGKMIQYCGFCIFVFWGFFFFLVDFGFLKRCRFVCKQIAFWKHSLSRRLCWLLKQRINLGSDLFIVLGVVPLRGVCSGHICVFGTCVLLLGSEGRGQACRVAEAAWTTGTSTESVRLCSSQWLLGPEPLCVNTNCAPPSKALVA